MTRRTLPHSPYITAVVTALTAAGLEPTEWWADDSNLDRYREDDLDGVAVMLDAVLVWDEEHPALDGRVHRHGIALLWDHPADAWMWAERASNGRFVRDPELLPALGRWSDPAAVADTVRALLTGAPRPTGHAPYWHEADPVRVAVAAWAAAEEAQGAS
ncbi:hypothetical protein AB0M23_32335 [Streptomyces sp. NPDC052077]|uniref:hypothetical protein n=1 Tax=Streptomyces sp. NPDC052077 TaxID=3154757 RepID=UPI0034306444